MIDTLKRAWEERNLPTAEIVYRGNMRGDPESLPTTQPVRTSP